MLVAALSWQPGDDPAGSPTAALDLEGQDGDGEVSGWQPRHVGHTLHAVLRMLLVYSTQYTVHSALYTVQSPLTLLCLVRVLWT